MPTPTTTTRLHQHFERSASCDCRKCVAACKSSPGYLIPGDVERIAEYLGADPDDEEFLSRHFRASEGPLVLKDGQLFRIPTIIPAQYDDNGKCVFLGDVGGVPDRCQIHQVSPFGCSRFSVCEPPSVEADRRSQAGLVAIMNNLDYTMVWRWLWEKGFRAPPLAERKAAMLRMVGEEEG